MLDQLRQGHLEAVELVHRHLPLFELRALLVVDQRAQHQLRRQLLLLRQPRGVDRAQPLDVTHPTLQRSVHLLGRVVRELIVIPLVPQLRGKLRIVLQPVLPYIREQLIQLFAAIRN